MRHDLMKLDQALLSLRDRRRDAVGSMRQGAAEAVSPFDAGLFRLHDELRESQEPLAAAIVEWLDVMSVERAGWGERQELEALWNAPHEVDHLEERVSLRELRRSLLSVPPERLQDAYRDGFVANAGPASDTAIRALVRRLEREGDRYFAVDGTDMAVDVAHRLLRDTAAIAGEIPRGLVAAAHVAVGATAEHGWPAHLTRRWLADVFHGTGLGAGLDLRLGRLPEPWGALSFARAFGQLGASLLDAARPKYVPFALHKRPRGHRRHARRALFASITLEVPFAHRILGLGAGRLAQHRRQVALALCVSLRFDALRVVVAAALRDGQMAGRELFSELTDRHFAQAAHQHLLGVLPRLRPADGPALVGAVVAFGERSALVDKHDEDWFRNPRAIEELRHDDEMVAGPAPGADEVSRALSCLKTWLESCAA